MKKIFLFFLILSVLATSIFSQSKEEALKILNSYKTILDTTETYTCILHEYVKAKNKTTDNFWDYKFMKPKYIRMESIKGDRLGSKAFFDYKTKKVTGRQGGILSKIKLTLDLSNSLVKNIRGITIAQSDWFYVLNRTLDILDDSIVEVLTGESKFKGIQSKFIHIKNIDFTKYGFDETKMFFDENNLLVGFYNLEKGEVVEDIHYQNIKINTFLTIDSLYVR
ncbi:MAG: hypothetical protein XD76_1674 [candidate division TA06 bacterium 32_111]|uniref:Outer membrane lipoprotein-sorting protein n=2 Tax=Bacteria candidate phyla TaxID=1783234 RepID=A0A124G068_UNCT6|nr:MAG: hypothetical protein XD76_1674 [candidate division TA06 bacterium 32_111]KUK86502.1 MAG: hypothetical protein XE03_1452 [candidate division TA06 bacterium 34_109]HAF07363.1 hypothetical protein [candidate division WOR-3 bacterium]HCP16530.1 hypothetical protein [candidate division WOR-3 bacterium]